MGFQRAKPADVQVQQSTEFDLAVHLKTARELRQTSSPADEVVE